MDGCGSRNFDLAARRIQINGLNDGFGCPGRQGAGAENTQGDGHSYKQSFFHCSLLSIHAPFDQYNTHPLSFR
jgi:hypothetical protein